MKIKNIKEYFDSAEDYAESEIAYLTGEVKDDLKDVMKKGINTFEHMPEMLKVIKQISLNNVFLEEAMIAAGDEQTSIIFKDDKDDSFNNLFFIVIMNNEGEMFKVVYGIMLDGIEYSKDPVTLKLNEIDKIIGGEIFTKFKEEVESFKEHDINIYNKPLKDANLRPEFNSVIYDYSEFLENKKN